MIVNILTFSKEIFNILFDNQIYRRAQKNNSLSINIFDLKESVKGRKKRLDDRPVGGGPGMVLLPSNLLELLERRERKELSLVISSSPTGLLLNSSLAKALSLFEEITFISGRFLGNDYRFTNRIVDLEVSIGNVVLSNGDLSLAVIVDSILRQVNGILNNSSSLEEESFGRGKTFLSHPYFSKEESLELGEIPSILKSGNHRILEDWKRKQSLFRTLIFRFDELKRNRSILLSKEEMKEIREFRDVLNSFLE